MEARRTEIRVRINLVQHIEPSLTTSMTQRHETLIGTKPGHRIHLALTKLKVTFSSWPPTPENNTQGLGEQMQNSNEVIQRCLQIYVSSTSKYQFSEGHRRTRRGSLVLKAIRAVWSLTNHLSWRQFVPCYHIRTICPEGNSCRVITYEPSVLKAIRAVWSHANHVLPPVIIIIIKKIGNARPGEGDCHPISPKTPAPHYQPIEEKKRKGK